MLAEDIGWRLAYSKVLIDKAFLETSRHVLLQRTVSSANLQNGITLSMRTFRRHESHLTLEKVHILVSKCFIGAIEGTPVHRYKDHACLRGASDLVEFYISNIRG